MAKIDLNLEHEFNETQWMSSYGFITAGRILNRYKIILDDRDVIKAMKTPETFYHQLIRLPLRNIMNDVIRQQAFDYQLYAQKLHVDYLLSGENSKDNSYPGANVRQELDELRIDLVALGKISQEDEFKHYQLIADSQKAIIDHCHKWQAKMLSQLTTLKKQQSLTLSLKRLQQLCGGILCYVPVTSDQDSMRVNLELILKRYDFTPLSDSVKNAISEISYQQALVAKNILEDIQNYMDQNDNLYLIMKHYRKTFIDVILKTNSCLALLSDYRKDDKRDAVNKEELQFDPSLGESMKND